MTAVRLGGAYPRVCGATPLQVPTLMANRGLSPRVRGNPIKEPGE